MDLNKIIQDTLVKFKEEQVLERIVRNQLEKTLKNVVEETLQSWSDFGESLKKHIKEELKVNLESLTLPEYNTLVMTWIKDIIHNNLLDVARNQIESNLNKFLAPITKKEWKLSEIVEKFKEYICGSESEEERYGTSFTFHCEKSDLESIDLWHVYLDEEEDVKQYNCKHNITICNGKISSVRSDKGDITKSKYKEFYGFDAFLFQLYSTTDYKITEMDEDAVDTRFGDY